MNYSAGHSWITYTPDGGETVTYGTYSNNPGGRGNGLIENWEKDNPSKYVPEASRTTHIDDQSERDLYKVIEQYRKKGWTISAPCSRFARDAWYAGTGERLRDTTKGGSQSNPVSLTQAIRDANRGVAHKTTPQRSR
jgi:hypothetical protein